MEATIYIVTKYVYWDEYLTHISGWEIFKNKTDAEIYVHNDQSADVYRIQKITADINKLCGE